MKSLLARLKNKIRARRWKYLYPSAIIYPNVAINRGSFIEKNVVIFSGTQIQDSRIGRFSYIQKNSSCTNVDLGPFCSIAPNVVIGVVDHPLHYIGTSPVFYDPSQPLPIFFASRVTEKVTTPRTEIAADVWIGQGVIIKAGVKIGVGAVIGAGSVVTKDIPPYSIFAGNPARLIRLRFSESICTRLADSGWWEFSDERLMNFSEYFGAPEKFLASIEKF